MRKKYKIFISVPTLGKSSSRNNDFTYYYDNEKNNEYRQTLNLLSESMKILPNVDITISAYQFIKEILS